MLDVFKNLDVLQNQPNSRASKFQIWPSAISFYGVTPPPSINSHFSIGLTLSYFLSPVTSFPRCIQSFYEFCFIFSPTMEKLVEEISRNQSRKRESDHTTWKWNKAKAQR